MASVGSVACDFVKGAAATAPRERVMSWFVPGVDGQSALLLGANEGEFGFDVIFYALLADVLDWYASLEGLQGSVVTITDDWGTAWKNCLIESVSILVRVPARGSDSSFDTRGQVAIRGKVMAAP